MGKNLLINSVVQFNGNSEWLGCLGIITAVQGPGLYTVGVPIPGAGTYYIGCDNSEIELIGPALFSKEDEDE